MWFRQNLIWYTETVIEMGEIHLVCYTYKNDLESETFHIESRKSLKRCCKDPTSQVHDQGSQQNFKRKNHVEISKAQPAKAILIILRAMFCKFCIEHMLKDIDIIINMEKSQKTVSIVGTGISSLTVALQLQKDGFTIKVYTKGLDPRIDQDAEQDESTANSKR